MSDEKTEPSKLDVLKNEADMISLDYPKDVKYTQLKKMLKDHSQAQQDALDKEDEEDEDIAQEPETSKAVADKDSNGMDFKFLKAGADTSKMNVTPAEEDLQRMGYNMENLSRREKATTLIRCVVVNMDPDFQTDTTIYKSVWNSKGHIAGRVIPFGLETHVEKCLIDLLNTEKYYFKEEVSTKVGDGTRVDIKTHERPKFAIQVLKPLTQKELKQLADDQRKTDRIG